MSGPRTAAAFNDPAGGKAIAEQLLANPDIDVIFQVAGKTGNGVLEAACEPASTASASTSTSSVSTPDDGRLHDRTAPRRSCRKNVCDAIEAHRGRHAPAAAPDAWASTPTDVGLSPFHDFESLITPEPGDARMPRSRA